MGISFIHSFIAGDILADECLQLSAGVCGASKKFQRDKTTIRPVGETGFVGGWSCKRCHEDVYKKWDDSHHDLAMQVADEETVLGDFNDVQFAHFDMISTFSKKNGKFFVNTDGPDGILNEFEISHTFGVYPLQQYLIPFSDGRYQVLSICWDSRPKKEGGQRWFHLYQNERINYEDELHWTKPSQNWNFMCAECHVTNLEKNYDLSTGTYATTWFALGVSCESCHGPAAEHVAWAESRTVSDQSYAEVKDQHGNDERTMGLTFRLKEPHPAQWVLDPKTMKYARSLPLENDVQLEICARCHSRRHVVSDDYVHGEKFLDHYRPRLLGEDVYHADGQMDGEVYVYGSFIQSRMYHKGVRCTDCHDPHSLEVVAPGNALCSSCHLPELFDTPNHHFHMTDSEGASCIACHMPGRKYMVVDLRRDHSIRIPRPDLSVKLGTPNACNDCHDNRDAHWASEAIANWYGLERRKEFHYGEALHAGRLGLPDASMLLTRLAKDFKAPAIARATGISLLGRYLNLNALKTVRDCMLDQNPLIRIGALDALGAAEPRLRLPVVSAVLNDPLRTVRIEAASQVAAVSTDTLIAKHRHATNRALDEFVAAQMANAERANAHLNLGNMYVDLRRYKEAESSYRTAMRVEPPAIAAYVNLADLYRRQGREKDCEQILQEVLGFAPDMASVHHALGLSLVRQQRLAEAIEMFARAAAIAPDDPQFSYVYALALNQFDRYEEAMEVLELIYDKQPNNRQILWAMATISRDHGQLSKAATYAGKLLKLDPLDTSVQQLLKQVTR